MKDLPFTWREFLQTLVDGLLPQKEGSDPAYAAALKLLADQDSGGADPWPGLLAALAALGKVKGYNLGGIKVLRALIEDKTTLDDNLSEKQSPEKRLFFLIEYGRGEMIMQNGTFSDYVALHVQGVVRVWLDAPRADLHPGKSCWDAPRSPASLVSRTWLGRAINRFLSGSRPENLLATTPYEHPATPIGPGTDLPGFPRSLWTDAETTGPQQKRDFTDRLMGVTSVVWKQPRTAALIADDDAEGRACRMVLIKRIFLQECLLFADPRTKPLPLQPTQMYLSKMDDFLKQSLPGLLAQNRLFRPLFYVEEVEDWQALVKGLASKDGKPVEPALQRLREKLPDPVQARLGRLEAAQLDEAARYRVVSDLNDFLNLSDLYDAKAWPAKNLGAEEKELLTKMPKQRTVVETYRLNRLLIETALPGVFHSVREFRPRTRSDFEVFVETFRNHSSAAPTPARPRSGDIIFKEGDPADGLYLILEGRVRLNLATQAGFLPFNHLVENGYFGETCIEDCAEPRHPYQAEALTNCNLLKIERPAVLAIAEQFPDFKNKLLREAARMRRRAEQVFLGHRLPPVDLPTETAAKLMRATNLLVIDMDRCTRCDQCVEACSEAHQGHQRFHRANPDLRIGRWEVAGACVHCSDAPCLEACPVGAITLLENGSVQVLRDRCISCRKCETACPFGVIEYHPPIDAADGASAKKDDYVVSHKCDLCLTPERNPPCVVACPYGAAMRGAPSEFFPGMKSMGRFTEPE